MGGLIVSTSRQSNTALACSPRKRKQAALQQAGSRRANTGDNEFCPIESQGLQRRSRGDVGWEGLPTQALYLFDFGGVRKGGGAGAMWGGKGCLLKHCIFSTMEE